MLAVILLTISSILIIINNIHNLSQTDYTFLLINIVLFFVNYCMVWYHHG